MPRIRLTINTPFGKIQISGDAPEEILEGLSWLNQDFLENVNERISGITLQQPENNLDGIVDIRKEGPVIITTDKMSHYEAIGLILYAFKDNQTSSRNIRERLAASGKKVTVPARLNEMRKRGLIFKPIPKKPIYKLSTQGVRWIEKKILGKLEED